MENKVYENVEHETETKQLNQITSIANDPNLYETPEDKSLGERIREARKSKGLTQQQLADIMGVSRSTITSIELGNNKPDSFTKNLIIKSLGIEESYFYLKPKDLTQINNFNIGETITYFRKCLNLTQLELAEKSFVTKDTIFKIESNKLIPRKPTLITISQALQVEPKILLEKRNNS